MATFVAVPLQSTIVQPINLEAKKNAKLAIMPTGDL